MLLDRIVPSIIRPFSGQLCGCLVIRFLFLADSKLILLDEVTPIRLHVIGLDVVPIHSPKDLLELVDVVKLFDVRDSIPIENLEDVSK